MAQLIMDSMQAIFDKLENKEHRYLRPLYIKGHVNGRPMTKMLVHGGAPINEMPYATYWKLGKGEEDLIKTDMMLEDFKARLRQPWGQSTLN